MSGDNAVVIALAARAVPKAQQRKVALLGAVAAVLLRIALTVAAMQLLELAFLQIAGGLLLLWIGLRMLCQNDDSNDVVKTGASMLAAMTSILLADVIMSLDNVVAVAAAAQGSTVLLIAGLAISIPLAAFGSTLAIRLMVRLPIMVTLGAMLAGWSARR